MRVAMVSFEWGELCMGMANALSQHAEVALALPRSEIQLLGEEQFDPHVRLIPFDKPRLRQPVRQAGMCRAILGELRHFDPDVVHVQQGHLWFNLILPIVRRWPLVVTIHDHTHHPGDRPSRKTPQGAANLAFRQADQLIIHSERLKREAIRLRDVPEAAIHVIPHVAIGDLMRAEHVVERENTVLFFGRLWPYKGLEYLIRAEPLISAEVPDVRFVIAGEGEDFRRYEQMMADPDRFEVHNEFVSAERRAELFAACAVVVLPYVEASQSGVVPVAYSFAKPVVATTVGGLPEAVEDGRTGYLVPPRDERSLAARIVTLLSSPARRAEMGAAGRLKLEREASAERVAAQTLEVYELARATRAGSLERAA